ncbi:MAG: dephospho-CoA kinase [Lachnospiraceae bacterium]|nr:dephospho-CoA kinase [Lachnospiraceae bacterium]
MTHTDKEERTDHAEYAERLDQAEYGECLDQAEYGECKEYADCKGSDDANDANDTNDANDHTHIPTKCIGITGGVGSGKSSVLDYLKKSVNCEIFISDEEAKKLYIPGSPVFDKIVGVLGEDVLDEDGGLNNKRFAARLFEEPELREAVNGIVHPAVNALIFSTMDREKKKGIHEFLFIEAALLIENGYEEILDEIWYIYASEETRRKRLKANRGYSDEKISSIFASQLSKEDFIKHTDRVIDNDKSPEDMKASVDEVIRAFRQKHS